MPRLQQDLAPPEMDYVFVLVGTNEPRVQVTRRSWRQHEGDHAMALVSTAALIEMSPPPIALHKIAVRELGF